MGISFRASGWLRSSISGLGGQQRDAELGAPGEPDVRPVARVAVNTIHAGEHPVYELRADHVAEPERPVRVVEAERHRLVDVGGLRGAALRDRAADVDDHGYDALRDEPGAVSTYRDRHPVRGQQAARALAIRLVG